MNKNLREKKNILSSIEVDNTWLDRSSDISLQSGISKLDRKKNYKSYLKQMSIELLKMYIFYYAWFFFRKKIIFPIISNKNFSSFYLMKPITSSTTISNRIPASSRNLTKSCFQNELRDT